MALSGGWAVLYYGLLASVTGGWLPVRAKNILLIFFHLFLFVLFIFLPFSVFWIRRDHWSGWFVYTIVVFLSFIILKVINFRLHRSLGTDPLPEEEEEEQEDNVDLESDQGEKPADDNKEPEESKANEDQNDTTKATEVDATKTIGADASQDSDISKTEESLQRHRDSASTLGFSSSARSGASQVVEMKATPKTEASMEVAERKSLKSIESGSSPLSSVRSRQASLKPPLTVEAAMLMSPVHRSSSNVDTSGTIMALPSDHTHHSEGEDDLEDPGIPRSYSMPPVMFDAENLRPSRDRERSGICIQRNQASRNHRKVLESRSEDELTTSGGRNEEGEEGATGQREHLDSYPRGRRNAFRGGARVARRTTCAADGNFGPTVAAAKRNISERTGSDTNIPEIREETEPSLVQEVRSKISDAGCYSLPEVIHLMVRPIHEAILKDALPLSWYSQVEERIGELRRGHLASGTEDDSPGAIHWYEVDGEWDFFVYPYPSDEAAAPGESLLEDSSLPIEELLAYNQYNMFVENFSSFPPRPPPRPRITSGDTEGEGEEEEEQKPVYSIIPFVKKTEITLKFPRKLLEEYMDRNVLWESVFTVILAVIVCVIATLLLTLVNFYQGFWIFWFCFVVATAHFSLIKSVQDDPASPTPGLNNIMAMGRAIYFIFCGVVALCINGALTHIGQGNFPPLCVYSFNINSAAVLIFVRNGLLIFILFFPVLFALGWLPQPNTFAIYFMEQFDMHVFGGTASTGLVCSVYAIIRSLLVGAVVWVLGFAAFSQLQNTGMRLTCASDGFSSASPQRCDFQDRIALSFYIGALFAAAYILSRSTTNHQYLWELIVRGCKKCLKMCSRVDEKPEESTSDPLEDIYCETLKRRLLTDLIISVIIFIVMTLLSLSTAFCRSHIPAYVIYSLTCLLGIVNHYFFPHVKKEMPWLCCSEPILKAKEWEEFEVTVAPKLSVAEKAMQYLLFLEKNILYPLTFLFAFNLSVHHYKARFGDFGGAAAMTIAGMKIIRTAWSDLPRQYMILIFTLFFFNFDYAHLSEGLPLNYFIIAILFSKFYDLYLKIKFIYIYIAPWQSSWSSAGHIVVQPLLIPHTPVIFLQTLIGAVMSAPMNPVYASTLFVLSYVRPVKYWEKDYNTKRADSSNTRLDTQLEGSLRNPNPDRLDSLFYEHLTWVLQKDLCGDLVLGRWGRVASGDFFILTSDRLNALVHIIEYGNGFVTFQLRGLEFRGTYCHQREVEAITESIADDDGCCYNEPGHLPGMLSCNKTFGSRWLAWEVVSSSYTLHGYSISENQAHLVFNSFDFRRGYITYYIECIIYKLICWPRLKNLLESEDLKASLVDQSSPTYCDKDSLFDESRNCDFSQRDDGILKEKFVSLFQPYVEVCARREGLDVDCGNDSFLLTVCYVYTLLGRRMFYQHAQHGAGRRNGDNFMNGLYRMFLGDARPNNWRDEWVFQDVDSIKDVIIPATRISLKVHQDNFTFSEEYDSPDGIYEAIKDVDENHIVTHENDHDWRTAVVTNHPSLLALRYQRTEESYIYPYKLIRLTSKFIKFRVIKLNRECVRSLWTGQQQELIFLRNSDSERGSIQNHKPTLRNMINSSMDLPIGYPIYVSPLQTSFIDRHETFNNTNLSKITDPLKVLGYASALRGVCKKCNSCTKKMNRNGSFRHNSISKGEDPRSGTGNNPVSDEGNLQRRESVDSLTGIEYDKNKPYEDPFPQSDSDSEEQLWKPMWVSKQVAITDATQIFDNFKMNWLKWRSEDEAVARKALKTHWKAWRPQEGMEGEVIHEWRPFHIDAVQRSHIDKVILLVKLTEDLYVLIKEQGVKEVQSHTVSV